MCAQSVCLSQIRHLIDVSHEHTITCCGCTPTCSCACVCTTLALAQTYGHAVGIHVFHVAHTCHVLCAKMALNMLIIGTYPYGHGMPYLDPLWTMYSTCPQHGCTSRYPLSSLSTLRHVMYMLCTSLYVLLTVLILGPYLGTTLNWTLKRAILGQ